MYFTYSFLFWQRNVIVHDMKIANEFFKIYLYYACWLFRTWISMLVSYLFQKELIVIRFNLMHTFCSLYAGREMLPLDKA